MLEERRSRLNALQTALSVLEYPDVGMSSVFYQNKDDETWMPCMLVQVLQKRGCPAWVGSESFPDALLQWVGRTNHVDSICERSFGRSHSDCGRLRSGAGH